MPIKVLPARLANQIAAGEVVERPASVLKELLENSIDSGATQITIEIEKGGHKKIKVTDNGSGICKDELELALSRHATSKVQELDDLASIATLGFRGEALASISSVSRLTLTSRPEEQSEAWQARCEGRDMQVIVEPAAHPHGTSVEVLDLFFNTPARRKFLRTEKTEFNHIEELFTRIALSRFDVALKLKHNGKLVKSLAAVPKPEEHIKRIQQICGQQVCHDLLHVESQYQEFRLHGWVSKPGAYRSINDTQYVFVNNRMMRDKLILHAIRQAYEGLLPSDKFPYFVLYLSAPLDEVDVNVHPAKHEVRFQQARLVHDFIYAGINDALNGDIEAQSQPAVNTPLAESARHNYQTNSDYIKPLSSHSSRHYQTGRNVNATRETQEAAGHYTQLMSSNAQNSASEAGSGSDGQENYLAAQNALWVPEEGVLFGCNKQFYFLSQYQVAFTLLKARYSVECPVSQPLLLPVSAKAEKHTNVEVVCEAAVRLGLEIQPFSAKLILKQVPVGSRKQRWQEIFIHIMEQNCRTEDEILAAMARFWEAESSLLTDFLRLYPAEQLNADKLLSLGAIATPLQSWLQNLQHD